MDKDKLMDYMMASCVILHSVSAGNDPVAEAGCGLTVPPESPQAISDAICCFMDMSPSERKKIGEKGKAYVLANHDYL